MIFFIMLYNSAYTSVLLPPAIIEAAEDIVSAVQSSWQPELILLIRLLFIVKIRMHNIELVTSYFQIQLKRENVQW